MVMRVTAAAGVSGVTGAVSRRPDVVVTEEPLEIRVLGRAMREALAVGVTMRTPGHDFELAAGYVFTEGLVTSAAEFREVRYCVRTEPAGPAATQDSGPDAKQESGPAATQDYNIVTVELAGAVDETLLRRATVMSSSCGLCGTDSIDHLVTSAAAIDAGSGPQLDASILLSLPGRLRRAQPLFDRTGGLHGVGLFTGDGGAVVVREDVGRHNAVDKVIGHQLLTRARGTGELVLVVSGRVSFEIVQKAAMAGLPAIVAVGAPTSLAIDAAHELGITLAGFVGPESANVYTHPQRVSAT
jgi:FdhD protein